MTSLAVHARYNATAKAKAAQKRCHDKWNPVTQFIQRTFGSYIKVADRTQAQILLIKEFQLTVFGINPPAPTTLPDYVHVFKTIVREETIIDTMVRNPALQSRCKRACIADVDYCRLSNEPVDQCDAAHLHPIAKLIELGEDWDSADCAILMWRKLHPFFDNADFSMKRLGGATNLAIVVPRPGLEGVFFPKIFHVTKAQMINVERHYAWAQERWGA